MKYTNLKKGTCTYLAIRVIVPCYYYSNLLTYALSYVTMLTWYFILVQCTVKNSRDKKINVIFNRELKGSNELWDVNYICHPS